MKIAKAFFFFLITKNLFGIPLNLKCSFQSLQDPIKSESIDYSGGMKRLQFEKYDFLLWTEGSELIFKIKKKGSESTLKHRMVLSGNFETEFTNEWKFKCLQENVQTTKKDEESYLLVQRSLVVPSKQVEENGTMRTLYWQSAKLYDDSSKLNQKLPWCQLRGKRREIVDNLYLNVGAKFKIINQQTNENNSYFTTYSYSFVDSSTGKISSDYSNAEFIPFVFRCNIIQGMEFTGDSLTSIVGEDVKLNPALK